MYKSGVKSVIYGLFLVNFLGFFFQVSNFRTGTINDGSVWFGVSDERVSSLVVAAAELKSESGTKQSGQKFVGGGGWSRHQ